MCVVAVLATSLIGVTVLSVILAKLKTDAHLVRFSRVDVGVMTCALAVLAGMYLLK
jgi:uncharacterized membrane protein